MQKGWLNMTGHERLIKMTQAWALRWKIDARQVEHLRREIILANHAHYLENIPVYRRFAEQEGIGQLEDIDPLKRSLMFPDDLFKSYDQRWLDEHDYSRMNKWLGDIHHRRVEVDVSDVTSIDLWIDRLGASGLRLVYSSGTSGIFSFVPRDNPNWELFRQASSAYIIPLLLHQGLGTALERLLASIACRLLPPNVLAGASRRMGVKGYDAVFLDFNQGRTGNQTLEQELAPLFRQHTFLYQTNLSPSVLRLARRGPCNDQERQQLIALQDLLSTRKEDNYQRIIASMQHSTTIGQKVFVFGTTSQYKELSELIIASGKQLELREGSLVLFGGGWKSFTGQRIQRDQLVAMMGEALGLPQERILEGYSMTEINAFTLRCEYGRFHIPPFIEPVIFDDELEPVTGRDLRGVFGFLDPFATSYPGFIITGDEVHYVEGECNCGLSGAAVTEIGRAREREVKGCGGIMSSLAA